MKLELIKLLADNGEPLEITTRETHDGTTVRRGQTEITVRRGQTEITVKQKGQFERMLRDSLRHYPREVRVNGERLETTPAPTDSMVEIMEHDGRNLEGYEFRMLHPRERERRFDMIVGGVGHYMKQSHPYGDKSNERRYLTPMTRQARHHRGLSILRTTTVQVVRTGEIGELRESHGSPVIPEPSTLALTVREQMREKEEKTLAREGMPEIYRGEVFEYALTGEEGDDKYYKSAPIEVTGNPVMIQLEYGEEAKLVSAASALYHADSEWVPVGMESGRHEYPGTQGVNREPLNAEVEFIMDPPDAGKFDSVRSITVQVKAQDGRTLSVPAQFHISGEFEDQAEVRVARGAGIENGELTDALVQAYWKSQDWDSAYEEASARFGLERRMENLATHVLGDNRKALEKELLHHAGKFFTMIPAPAAPVSVTANDGRITITMHPAEQEQAA